MYRWATRFSQQLASTHGIQSSPCFDKFLGLDEQQAHRDRVGLPFLPRGLQNPDMGFDTLLDLLNQISKQLVTLAGIDGQVGGDVGGYIVHCLSLFDYRVPVGA